MWISLFNFENFVLAVCVMFFQKWEGGVIGLSVWTARAPRCPGSESRVSLSQRKQ
jgi:hypothetical protein